MTEENIQRRGRGRPRKPVSEGKTRNITVSTDLIEEIDKVCGGLEKTLGFRPTISQALKYLIRNFEHPGDAA